MEKLLTQTDLAERWQMDISTIYRMRNEGRLQPIKHLLPTIRFSLSYIQKLEETEIDRMSSIERKRLELEIVKLQKENEKLKEVARAVFQQTSQVIGI